MSLAHPVFLDLKHELKKKVKDKIMAQDTSQRKIILL